jgi:uncharacterized protein YegL
MFDEIFDDIEKNLMESEKVQFVGLILDKSGSMAGMESTTRDIVHEQVSELLDLSKETNIHTYATIAVFSDHNDFEMETFDLVNQKSVDECDDYTRKNYRCGGLTALFDSMQKVISHIQEKNDENKGKEIENLVIVVSDGLENDSREITDSNILKKQIDKFEEQDDPKWKFVYLGTMESLDNARDTSIKAFNTMSFDKNPIDMKQKFTTVSASNRAYYSSRVTGQDTRAVHYNDNGDFTIKKHKNGYFTVIKN